MRLYACVFVSMCESWSCRSFIAQLITTWFLTPFEALIINWLITFMKEPVVCARSSDVSVSALTLTGQDIRSHITFSKHQKWHITRSQSASQTKKQNKKGCRLQVMLCTRKGGVPRAVGDTVHSVWILATMTDMEIEKKAILHFQQSSEQIVKWCNIGEDWQHKDNGFSKIQVQTHSSEVSVGRTLNLSKWGEEFVLRNQ